MRGRAYRHAHFYTHTHKHTHPQMCSPRTGRPTRGCGSRACPATQTTVTHTARGGVGEGRRGRRGQVGRSRTRMECAGCVRRHERPTTILRCQHTQKHKEAEAERGRGTGGRGLAPRPAPTGHAFLRTRTGRRAPCGPAAGHSHPHTRIEREERKGKGEGRTHRRQAADLARHHRGRIFGFLWGSAGAYCEGRRPRRSPSIKVSITCSKLTMPSTPSPRRTQIALADMGDCFGVPLERISLA